MNLRESMKNHTDNFVDMDLNLDINTDTDIDHDTDNNSDNNHKKGKKDKNSLPAILLRMVVWLLLACEIAMAMMIGIKVISMEILPMKYLIAIFILFLIVNGLVVFFNIRKQGAIPLIVVLVLLCAVFAYGATAIAKVDNTLNKMSDTHYVTTTYAVAVRKSDPAQTMSDIKGYSIGYSMDDTNAAEAKNQLGKQVPSLTYKIFDNESMAATSLLEERTQAILIREASIEMLSDSEDLAHFADSIRVVGTIEIKTASKTRRAEELGDRDTFVVYISGIDTYGDVTAQSRSDVNIIAFVNLKTGKMQLISTPRDYYVQCPLHDYAYDKLTNCGLYGIKCSEDTLEHLYGETFTIDYYVRLNFSGFMKIIDELGGIDVYNESSFTSVDGMYFAAGDLHLNGQAALYFARERKAFRAGDIMRAKHQMAVIKAMISKMTSTAMLKNYSKVLDAVADSFQTDMPSETIYSLVNYQLDKGTNWQVESFTLEGEGTRSTDAYSQKGRSTYVMLQDEKMIAEAKRLIEENMK